MNPFGHMVSEMSSTVIICLGVGGVIVVVVVVVVVVAAAEAEVKKEVVLKNDMPVATLIFSRTPLLATSKLNRRALFSSDARMLLLLLDR
jgi:hypothetical protein|tara:strand:- start:223 stop:492 length:270 start_codon:yes stop_codon:yes gene_type:complete